MKNNLKTLADIPTAYTHDEFPISRGDLKKEAIKWYNRSDDDKHAFIKKFFNITDEDIIDAKGQENEQ